MKNPAEKSCFSSPTPTLPDQSEMPEKDKGDLSKSDLHDDNLSMMTEIYGENFHETWKRSHKNWWL